MITIIGIHLFLYKHNLISLYRMLSVFDYYFNPKGYCICRHGYHFGLFTFEQFKIPYRVFTNLDQVYNNIKEGKI